ncbi:MAG: hypothetical protein M3P33_03170 [bacterium]|nr:hypothetical protein [bacterium]
MNHQQNNAQTSLMITLGLISVFLMTIFVSALPLGTTTQSLTQNEVALAGVPEPSDTVEITSTPSAIPVKVTTATPKSSNTASPSAIVLNTTTPSSTPFSTPSATPLDIIVETSSTPVPTFNLDLPSDNDTSTPAPAKSQVKGTSNMSLIIAAVVGTLLFLTGITFLIISKRHKAENNIIPPTTPPPAQTFSNNPYNNPPPIIQPGSDLNNPTPYDQYVNPNLQDPPKNS